MSEFIVRDGDQVRRVPVDGLMTIGRSRSNSLVLESSYASRRHAWIWQQGDRVIIEDLGSTHGTLVNGQRLKWPRFLNHHDVITIGDALLTFMDDRVLPAFPGSEPRFMVSRLLCPFCSAPNHPQATHCVRCGQTLAWELGYGLGWGSQVAQGWTDNPTTPVQRVVARPFPVTSTQQQPGTIKGVWVLILILSILTVILLTTVALLVVYTIT